MLRNAGLTWAGIVASHEPESPVYYPNADHRPSHKDALAAYGELRAWDFKQACWSLIHDGVEASLASGDPLRLALAVLHRKTGKRRLHQLAARPELHPLVRHLVAFRLAAGLSQHTVAIDLTQAPDAP